MTVGTRCGLSAHISRARVFMLGALLRTVTHALWCVMRCLQIYGACSFAVVLVDSRFCVYFCIMCDTVRDNLLCEDCILSDLYCKVKLSNVRHAHVQCAFSTPSVSFVLCASLFLLL